MPMRLETRKYNAIFISLLIFSACTRVFDENQITEIQRPIQYPIDFDFKTTSALEITVETTDNVGNPLTQIPLSIYQIHDGNKTLLASGQSDKTGVFVYQNELGNHIDSIEIATSYLGLPSSTQIAYERQASITLSGKPGYEKQGKSNQGKMAARTEASSFSFSGAFDSNGVPYYLEPVDDHISQDLLDLINTSLPERFPVPIYNPQYIVDSVSSDTKLQDEADIWVTFVHEGAGWRNSLGYYTYDLNNPPTSIDDIDSLHIIFPNVSFVGLGGGLESGNKVYLGAFPANTGIGWFLVPNSWTGADVAWKDQIKFSNKDFNTYTAAAYRTHTVLLKDTDREILLLGMEDTTRPGGDNDFNDAVFYVTANPFSAVITNDLVETTKEEAPDSDGDGVADKNDEYPNDPNKAFDIFTPGEDIFGTVAFEDLYPSKGDFDMNDLVIDYHFQNVANVSNKIVEIKATFHVKALGAMLHSGFGFTLPVAPAKIASITGQDIRTGDQISLQPNGTESGQSQTVILVFEDAFRVWEEAYGQTNTIPEQGYVSPHEMELTISFTEPISNLELGYVPYDPFIFNSVNRGVEVHLINGTPTDLADLDSEAMWSLSDDRMAGSNYRTFDHLPYAINLPVSFDYPHEGASMSEAFIHFDLWAQSANLSFPDWYINKSGYRQSSKIYQPD